MRKGDEKMSHGKSWLPTREESLAALMAIWQTKLANQSLQTAYGWVATECTTTITTITTFLTMRATYQTTPTNANHTMKEETKAAAQASMRKFARERIRFNAKMSDGQREELGVPTPDPEPTPVPVPSNGPTSMVDTTGMVPGVVKLRYMGAKPYGVDRIEIAWALSDIPIDRPHLLHEKDTFSRNPWEHIFEDERGKRMYYAMRYLTREGASPWSAVREVTVP
jgi:hypothetical protein